MPDKVRLVDTLELMKSHFDTHFYRLSYYQRFHVLEPANSSATCDTTK